MPELPGTPDMASSRDDSLVPSSRFETPEYNLSEFKGYQARFNERDRTQKYFVTSENHKLDVDETAKRFAYLLGLTGLFSHFINAKAAKDPEFQKVLDVLEAKKGTKRRKTEKEEDAELLQDEKEGQTIVEFTESPGYVDGQLRPYQIAGLNWLISLHENNLSGILADEMGLGKTLQTISFLGYLRYLKCVPGPHLVLVPKSTLDNWAREFKMWTPEVSVLILQGDKDQRQAIIQNQMMKCEFDVVITSYEVVIIEKASFKKFAWEYIVIDEAHRIKNEESLLSQIIRMFHSKNRLLITGTPLQNNLHELWALLNFILPDVFADSETFDEWFQKDATTDASNGEVVKNGESVKAIDGEAGKSSGPAQATDSSSIIQQLHKVLKPFLLRRIKSDVEKSLLPKKEINLYVGMSEMQRTWYQKILEKDLDAVNSTNGKKESKTRLLNIVMQLRKCCNHPYLFDGAEPGPPYTTDEHLVYNANKTKVLDKLLKRLRQDGSRVLIFSQMSRMLDILEDYCIFRGYKYSRIDGLTDHADRVTAIDDYNAPDSDKFAFLLTTRAGGLGINLTSADVVILYDSDWNPQADLQAMDRAHRIGQTKQVKVFRFVTENAVEEKVLERATQKLRLDQLVIQQGRNAGELAKTKANSKDELLSMIQFGAVDVFGQSAGETDDDIERILAKSETKTATLASKYATLGLDDLQNFSNSGESVYEWNGQSFKKKEITGIGNVDFSWNNPAKRERKENYSIDLYYKDILNTGGRTAGVKTGPRPPKQLNAADHQFYPAQLFELHEMEKSHFRKGTGYVVPLVDGPVSTLEEREQEQLLEQQEIRASRPLTEAEEALKAELLEQGFGYWARREFLVFIQMCARYGRNNIHAIASELEDKTPAEVHEYATVFWKRYREIDGHERFIAQIETGEEKLRKLKLQMESLRRKVAQYPVPLQDLVLQFPPSTSGSRRVYSDEEDRYLLVQMYRFGLDRPDLYELLRDAIRVSPLFRFDFFFQSRTPAELNRRCHTLLMCVVREFEGKISLKRGEKGEAAAKRVKRS
ncbi:hypothetical protein BABINDRAFT_163239 [Babjeviella inositovora NRRL Y-12698]|uniref:Helicase SWR1 n=1 Tax=Babjeviella inositovora NRRL Y-12698 TaxID=984486 RepID=A0A1E3QJJ1_9ASCO|nr:uncharacterized protein BABINDRAFT_163239 [Babjeviella inositovora NRRL Y-12698]ODQ77861.1 hypothetical protein BABINDRAFT_163239 [Babjeviella inositovora NRRL Y-12698]